MKILSASKIDPFREMVDCEVSRICLDRGLSRPDAYMSLVKDYGGCFRFYEAPGCVIGVAIPGDIDDKLCIKRREIDGSIATEDVVEIFCHCMFLSSDVELAATAAVLICIDSCADLFDNLTVHDRSRLMDRWRIVAGAMNMSERGAAAPGLSLDPDRFLFETEEQWQDRLKQIQGFRKMESTVLAHMGFPHYLQPSRN